MITLIFVIINFIFASDYFDKSIMNYPIQSKSLVANQKSDMLLSDTVDPNTYYVGPGDKFFLSLISNNITINEYLVVSPLGDLILPNLSLVNVDKLNLIETFKLIEDKYSKKFINIEFSMTLADIRKFKVEILGLLNSPLFITSNPLHTVSDVYNILKTKNISNINNKNISERNIILDRNNEKILIDMLGVKKTDYSFNPFLMEGDKLYIEPKREEIYIEGAINYKGSYEYTENESLYDFITLIGGFSINADTNNIKISRFSSDDEQIEIFINQYNDSKEIFLHPYDHINVQFIKNYKKRSFVTIEGEINTPGIYVLENDMTFENLLIESGGYTDFADSNKILINNNNFIEIRDPEFERIELIPPQNRSISEISYLKSRKIVKKGSMISKNTDITKKILKHKLNPNDIIKIPKLVRYVEIIGGINNPGLYPYSNNLTINDLIDLAGGKSKGATRKVYIINSLNQKNRVRKLTSSLRNGDVVFIETKQDMNLWNKLQESMGLMGQVATLIAVIQSAQNN